jgi:cytidylate kinase
VLPNLAGLRQKEEGRKKPKGALSVIVSGMPSVGKTTVALSIARRFGWKIVAGGDMLKKMAIERGYKPAGADWWDTTQGMQFLSERDSNPDFDKEVDRKLIEIAAGGDVVITSYTLPWIYNGGLKIWLSASQRTRASRLAKRDSISISRASEIVKQRDEENRLLYRKLYGIDFGRDLSVFNFRIDTDKLPAEKVATVALRIVEEYVRVSSKWRHGKQIN